MATGGVVDDLPSGVPLKQMPMWDQMEPEEDLDPLFDEAVDLVRRQGRASISMLQRRLRISITAPPPRPWTGIDLIGGKNF